jgi:hypothetical protein
MCFIMTAVLAGVGVPAPKMPCVMVEDSFSLRNRQPYRMCVALPIRTELCASCWCVFGDAQCVTCRFYVRHRTSTQSHLTRAASSSHAGLLSRRRHRRAPG